LDRQPGFGAITFASEPRDGNLGRAEMASDVLERDGRGSLRIGKREAGITDREIVLVKLYNHRRDKVFAAWMNPRALAAWYGPASLK
jgi:hypothetical protein